MAKKRKNRKAFPGNKPGPLPVSRGPVGKRKSRTPDEVFGELLKRKRGVHVGFPCMGGQASLAVMTLCSQLDRLTFSESCPFKFSWQILNDVRPVEHARNKICQVFLDESGADVMLFCDADMVPDVEAMLKVLAVIDWGNGKGYDMATARTYAWDATSKKLNRAPGLKVCSFHYNAGNKKFDPVQTQEPDSSPVVPIDGAGTGFLAIHRRVFDDERMRLDGDYIDLHGVAKNVWEEDDQAPAYFRTLYRPNGSILRGEDLDFTFRARLLGHTLAVNLAAEVGHQKTVNLDDIGDVIDGVAQKSARGAVQRLKASMEARMAVTKSRPGIEPTAEQVAGMLAAA